MIKRLISFILLLSVLVLPVFSVNTANLGCENVDIRQGEFFTVPLSLTNNEGIVAVRIKIKYPDNVMELTDISSGELTEEGLFNTTVTDYYSVNGEFDVVWSTTENVVGDGTFVMLTFKAHDLAENGRYKIEISYDKADTFNENLEDVHLVCSPVTVTINDGTAIFDEIETQVPTEAPLPEENVNSETQTETTNTLSPEITFDQSSTDTTIGNIVPTTEGVTVPEQKPEEKNETTTEENKVSDDYFISSVDSIIGSLNQPDIDNITDTATQQNILGFVNNRIDAFGDAIPHIESFEELKDKYFIALENEATKDIVESTDDEVILGAYEEILQNTDIENITKIPEEKKKDVIGKFTEILEQNNSDIQQFNRLDDEQKLSVLEKVVDAVSQRSENYIEVNQQNQNDNDYTILIIAVSAIAVTTATGITFFIIKRKKGNQGKYE